MDGAIENRASEPEVMDVVNTESEGDFGEVGLLSLRCHVEPGEACPEVFEGHL